MPGPPQRVVSPPTRVREPRGAAHEEPAEEDAAKRPPHFWSTLVLLYLVCVVEGADGQLLPATFRALEADLGMTPTHLAVLGLSQALAMSVSAPVWGSLADHGWSRKWILTGGAVGWGILTMLLAMITHFPSMLILRVLNGAALGTLTPVSQSLVADMTKKSERGFFFGFGQMGVQAGAIACAIFATSISNMVILGFDGWRIAFATVAVISFVLALGLAVGMAEPPRSGDGTVLTLSRELKRFRGYWRIDTFKVIVAQGVFGSVPWSALSFVILFFQYCGLSDVDSALIFGAAMVGQGLGGVLGGCVGDRLALWSPNHGRAFTAEISVSSGIPLIAAVLLLVPHKPESFWSFFVLMFMFGLLASWCGTGVNRPIMAEIVDDRGRASVIAWLTALEGSSSACLGGPIVGLLSQYAFGYQSTTMQVHDMPRSLRRSNAAALSDAMFWCTIGPWVACLLLFSLLHITYGPDVAKCEADVAARRRQARATTALI